MFPVDSSTGSCTAIAVLEEDGPDARIGKVLEIRRQLSEGSYNITKRLDAVVERLLDVVRS